jgi:hypothetical protein
MFGYFKLYLAFLKLIFHLTSQVGVHQLFSPCLHFYRRVEFLH